MIQVFLTFLLFAVAEQLENESLTFRLLSSTGPEARKDAAIAYDQRRKQIFIFGGIDQTKSPRNDLWAFDLKTNEWTLYNCSSSTPPPLSLSVSGLNESSYTFTVATGCDYKGAATGDAYDVGVGQLGQLSSARANCQWTKSNISFTSCGASGGVTSSGQLFAAFGQSSDGLAASDGLTKEHIEWHLTPYKIELPHPRNRQAGTMIDSNKLLVHGGCLSVGQCPAADSWILHGNGHWERIRDDCSPPRMDAAMAMLHGYAVIYGGTEASNQAIDGALHAPADEVLVLHLNRMSCGWSGRKVNNSSPSKPLRARRGHAMVTAGEYGIIVFGGEVDGEMRNDIWQLTGDPDESDQVNVRCSTYFSYFHLHGILMFIAYGILMPVAIFSVRYTSKEKPHGWIIHVALQTTVFLLATAGFVFSVVSVSGRADHPHFQFKHAILGVILYALTVGQVLTTAILFIGGARMRKKAGKYTCNKYWRSLHVAVGVAIVLLAITNISLGLIASLLPVSCWASWFGLLSFYLLLTLVLDCRQFRGIWDQSIPVIKE